MFQNGNYEFQTLNFSRQLNRSAVTQLLTEMAEQGHWVLDRTRIFPDGRRAIRVKRRIIYQRHN